MNNMDIVPFASLEEALKDKKISLRTYERVKIAKGYIEKKYKMKRVEEEEKRKDWDLIMSKIDELQISQEEADKIKKEILHKEGEYLRLKRQRILITDFESIAIIGKGAFGEVRVCKYKQTGEIVAIKKMKKEEMHKKNQVLHVREEQMVLSEANNPWIVDLKFSFQDENFLYLVMEFLPGGDLMSLLMTKDILTEEESRFYAAELVLAIESVHKLNCIHRDLKPDNVLIDKDGHIKLSDFGLSKKVGLNLYENENINGNCENNPTFGRSYSIKELAAMSKSRKRRIYAFSTVGTPDYIAPEVFSQKGYGPEVDWWSLGVILFEMLIGYPPFFSDSATDTCKKILNWKTNLVIPPESKISRDAVDLIKRLITDVDKRLGYHGADEIKKHPFFRGVNWNNISSLRPGFIPEIDNEWDTRYFDQFDEDEPFYPVDNPSTNSKKTGKDICFVNFTYKREMDNYKSSMVSALEVLDSLKESLKKADNNLKDLPPNLEENGANYRNEVKESVVINNNMFHGANLPEEENSLKSGKSSNENQNITNILQTMEKMKNLQEKYSGGINYTPNYIQSPHGGSKLNQNSNSNGFKEDYSSNHAITNLNIPAGNNLKPNGNGNNNNKVNNNNIPVTNQDLINNDHKMNNKPSSFVTPSVSKDLLKQASKIKKTVQNNHSEQFFSNKSNSNNQNGNSLQNQVPERLGGSDYLLKNNNDLEKKLVTNKTKIGFSNMGNSHKSPFDSKEKVKKVGVTESKINSNINSPFMNEYNSSMSSKVALKKAPTIKIETPDHMSNTHEDFKLSSLTHQKGISKKVPEKTTKINYNYNSEKGSNLVFNNQPNSLITTNYLKDFTNSENAKIKDSPVLTNLSSNKSNIKLPSSQVKVNPTKEVNINLNKGNSDKPLSTKSSAGKKIVFTASSSNLNSLHALNALNTGAGSSAASNLNYQVNPNTGVIASNYNTNSVPNNVTITNNIPNKFLKMKDSSQTQRIFEKVKKK